MSDTSKNYGGASYSGASSDTPGQRTVSSLAAELETKQTGLDNVIANGSKHADDPSRFTGRGNKPTPSVAVGCKPSTPADWPKVPGPGRPSTTRG
jgi:hypothetical protein